MDEVLFMATIYDKDGHRIGMEIGAELALIAERAPVTAKAFGKGSTFKLWECKEVPQKAKE
jgi:hypothetical protein